MPFDSNMSDGRADQARVPDGVRSARTDRRSFLKTAGVGGAVVAGAAVLAPSAAFGDTTTTTSTTSTTTPGGSTTTTTPKFLSPDAKLATFAQELEVVAVAIYTKLAPQLGDSLKALSTAFSSHHQDAAVLFGALIDPTTPTDFTTLTANPKLLASFQSEISGATSRATALSALQKLEETIAATHLASIAALEDRYNTGNFAKVQAVTEQHAAILAQEAGAAIDTVVPAVAATTGALTATDFDS